MSEAFAMFIGTTIGFFMGCETTHDEFVDRLIKAELAEFVVDSTTGDTAFIIYAEELTSKEK